MALVGSPPSNTSLGRLQVPQVKPHAGEGILSYGTVAVLKAFSNDPSELSRKGLAWISHGEQHSLLIQTSTLGLLLRLS